MMERGSELEPALGAALPASIVRSARDAIVATDLAGTIVSWNPGAERLYGFAAAEALGQPIAALILPVDPHVDEQQVTARVVAGDRLDPYRTLRRHRDGHTVAVSVLVSALTADDGRTVGLMSIARELDDRQHIRLREEAERDRLAVHLQRAQRLESLGQLAGGVAHDFNNLLAVILNYAAFIIEDGAGTPFAADAEQIAHAGRRGSELTHQLLAFARREVIRPRPLDLNTVVRDVQQMLSRSIGEHIAFSTHLALTLPPVMADAGQLEQVLVNLAVNARDAMPSGGRLTIDTTVVDIDRELDLAGASRAPGLPPGRYVRLRVADSGTGMPPEVVDRAFDPFFTTKPKGEGTGLGLATVYGIVTQAGGTIQIDSVAGAGTTITVLLPVTAERLDETEGGPDQASLQGHGETILVVEDEAALRQVTSRILRRAGYTVLTASGGAAALELAGSHPEPIDVLLTDVVMPGLLGPELAARLVAGRPHTAVLYMSGYAQPVLTSNGTLAPDVRLIEKPFTSTELLTAVYGLLTDRRSPSSGTRAGSATR
jgi:two-component system, cell cycle sensor histidine kinase and response regulator CckA